MAERKIGSLVSLLPHPGETLLELLDIYGMSQLELAQRIGYTPKHINEVCKGNMGITPDMAIKLSTVFNLSSAFWNNLQANYDSEYRELLNEETVTEEELSILKDVPVNELIRYHYLERVYDPDSDKLYLKVAPKGEVELVKYHKKHKYKFTKKEVNLQPTIVKLDLTKIK